MNYLSKEIARLEARIEVLKNESEMDTSVYDFVEQQIDSIETTQHLTTIA